MAAPNRHGIYPFYYGGASTLNQIGAANATPGVEKLIARPGGQTTPAAIGTAFAAPKFTVSFRDVATLLALNSGGFFANGLALTNAIFQMQKRAAGGAGVFLSGANHYRVTAAKAFLFPTEIATAQDDREGAAITCEMLALYDGTNVPLSGAASQSLSGTPAVGDVLFMGPLYAEGAALDGLQSMRIVSGITANGVRGDGDTFPREAHIVEQTPLIEATFLNPTVLTTLGIFGSGSVSGIACYLRRGGHGVSRQSDASAVHTKFSFSSPLAYFVEEWTVEGTGDTVVRVQFQPAGLFTVSTTSTIP